MEKMLSAILEEIKGLKADVDGLKTDVGALKTDVGGLKQGQDQLRDDIKSLGHTIDIVHEQTANLTEFRTEANDKLDNLIENQKSLYEMYGKHEMEIRNLRRRPV